jgi:hypothetical protein
MCDALRKALTEQAHGRKGRTTAEATERVSRALADAVAQCWSILPQDIQHKLFEAAVTSQGEKFRQELAVYLYGKHDRTSDVVQPRAVPEPDSLAG